MDYDMSPGAPSWVDFAPRSQRGLDLLGLRLPVQAIGLSLLNAVTTIAPKVRYLSFRTFLADAYRTAPDPPPDSRDAFMAFALPAEAAFALSNTLVEPSATNIVGIGRAGELLEAEGELIALEKLVAQPALNIYGQPAESLELVGNPQDGAPWVGKDVGHPLAQELRKSWGATALGRRFLDGETLGAASREDLREFGEACAVDKLLDGERRLLIDAVIPESPISRGAVERVRTCALLLQLSRYRNAEGARGLVTEAEFLSAARQLGQSFPEVLRRALDGWLLYQVRDCLAVVHEAALGEVVAHLNSEGGGPGGVLGTEVVEELLSYGSAFDRVWTDLGLPGTLGSLDDIRLADLAETIETECSDGVVELGGLRRWNGVIDEWKVIEARRGYGSGVLLLLPLAWLLSDLRAGRGVREKGSLFDGLSLGGSGRMGMRQVVLPRLRANEGPESDVGRGDWRARGPDRCPALGSRPVAACGDSGKRCRGAQSRGQTDGSGSRSGALHPVEPHLVCFEVTGWLHQLELISDAGLTAEGVAILDRALDSLAGTAPR